MENDIVLIYIDDAPAAFARIEEIRPDVKKDWFIIKLLMLQVPLQVVSWILKADYINGAPFSMNGRMMRLEKVVCPADDAETGEQEKENTGDSSQVEKKEVEGDDGKTTGKGEVISFASHRKSGKKE